MNKHSKQWGDPMSYSDLHIAKAALKAPNKFICIRCLAQSLTEKQLIHETGCPETRKKVQR